MATAPRRDHPRRPSRWWYLLLALPVIGLVAVPLYAHDGPRLAGVPFFYWYQFAWVPLASVLTAIVYKVMSRPAGAPR